VRIGIDISQLAYKNTGVANYLKNLTSELINLDKNNEYILFCSSRGEINSDIKDFLKYPNVFIKHVKLPPTILDILWNRLHILPIEKFIGKVDMFITSDWTEPPVKNAKKGTILYDLIVYKYPNETDRRIISTQKRKLKWVKKESDIVFCISEATKKDAMEILGIDKEKLKVIYPGINGFVKKLT
jgi:glycosyltransferase involved in cell wall biosynthesis